MKTQKVVLAMAISLFSYTATMAQMHDHSKMKTDDSKTKVSTRAGTDRENKTTYACPMKCEGEKTYEKEGKCPKCGMALTKNEVGQKSDSKKKSSGKKDDKTISPYSCPMKCEGDKTYTKAGDCPKCGMKLKTTKKEEDHSGHNH